MRTRFSSFNAIALIGLILSGGVVAQPTDVFISEYIEGTSNNKAIEIFNGTGSTVDLAAGQYQLEYYFNGSASAGLTIALTGSVANGDVHVVAHSSANATILAQADQTNGSSWFNGDDAIVLRKGGASGAIVDSIGVVAADPGSEWGTGLTSTADNTLQRKDTVCAGDVDTGGTFDPSVEWNGFATDNAGNLGAHAVNCPAAQPDLTINDVTLGEGDSGTTTFTFTVSLSAPAPADVGFDIATADDTATVADGDYVANSATGQVIATGQQSANFSVTVNGDDKYEPNGQQFFVNVTNVTGANVIDGQGVGTITDNDTYPQLSAEAAVSVNEGNAGNQAATITYTLSNPADQDTTVTVSTADGTATLANGDYVQLSGATFVIPAGDTTFDYTGAMAVGDVAVESNEDFTVAVDDYLVGALGRAPKGVTLPAPTVVTIVNDDASADLSITVTDSPDPVTAGQNITYVVTLTNVGPSNADGANFTLPLPAGTTFVSLAQPGMWSCTTPAVGANGSVSCNDGVVTAAPQGAAKMGVGSAQFTIVANVPTSIAPGTVLTSGLSSSATTADPNGQNNATTAVTTVAAAAMPAAPIPTLDPRMLAMLALLVAGIAATSLRRNH